jgi:hypothetical protein
MASQVEGGANGNPPNMDEPWLADKVTIGNPYHLSRGTRTFLRIVSVILVFSMTALFVQGFIHT